MPIAKHRRELYLPPKLWKPIRDEVLERERHKCKTCRAPNGIIVWRGRVGDTPTYMLADGETFHAETGAYIGCVRGSEYDGEKKIKIVLTIAHLNHDPQDNGEPGNRPNLAALCQLHHLRHDQAQHAASAAETSRRKQEAAGQMRLIERRST